MNKQIKSNCYLRQISARNDIILLLKPKPKIQWIPTLKEANQREKQLKKFHLRGLTKRRRELQNLSSQNGKIYVSLNRQKSSYELQFRDSHNITNFQNYQKSSKKDRNSKQREPINLKRYSLHKRSGSVKIQFNIPSTCSQRATNHFQNYKKKMFRKKSILNQENFKLNMNLKIQAEKENWKSIQQKIEII